MINIWYLEGMRFQKIKFICSQGLGYSTQQFLKPKVQIFPSIPPPLFQKSPFQGSPLTLLHILPYILYTET